MKIVSESYTGGKYFGFSITRYTLIVETKDPSQPLEDTPISVLTKRSASHKISDFFGKKKSKETKTSEKTTKKKSTTQKKFSHLAN